MLLDAKLVSRLSQSRPATRVIYLLLVLCLLTSCAVTAQPTPIPSPTELPAVTRAPGPTAPNEVMTQTPRPVVSPSPSSVPIPSPPPATSSSIVVDLPAQPSIPFGNMESPRLYAISDLLSDFFTNATYPRIIEGKPWTNSTVNMAQFQEELGGVTYWDFFSEPENWESPFYMWQRDNGDWQPYSREIIKDAKGKEYSAYLLLDRSGPGAMDKLWFAEDAVWMLDREQSVRDVGPIQNMGEFIEWGNLQKLGNLRIEVDERTAYDGPIRDWLNGSAWGLKSELASILTWRHRDYGSSGTIIPIPYQKRLRVFLYGGAKKPKWFLATGVRFEDSTSVQPYTGTSADLTVDHIKRLAANILSPAEYINTLPDVRSYDLTVIPGQPSTVRMTGPGTVSSFQLRIPKGVDPRRLRLRILYQKSVAADLPLVAFFGDPRTLVLHNSTPLGAVERGGVYVLYSNLPLPFQDSLTLEFTTEGTTSLTLESRIAITPQASKTQLWVSYQPAVKLQMYGPDYVVQIPGDGKLVGLVLASGDQGIDSIPKMLVDGKPDEEDPIKRTWLMGYLEGNLVLRDGVGRSRIYSGQEDWADAAFYFNRGYTNPPGGGNRPFGGILRYLDGKDGYATIFRYFNDLSAFRFENGLTLSFGHGTWKNNFPVRYGTTVYYYRQVGK